MTKLSENAYEVVKKRYFEEGETRWEEVANRVAIAISANEHDKKWKDIFATEINDMLFIPGGRILRNAGKLKQSMLNCGTLPIADSIESIGEAIKNALIMWKFGAGLGISFSSLRYRGAPLVSGGGESSGMVSFLHAFDAVAHTIETGGQRRSGCLALLSVRHPEIFDFINSKIKDKTLSYFNLSVGVDKSFITAVEEDLNWDLKFAGQIIKTIKARDLWERILEGMVRTGEPGLINIDNLRKNNSFYFQPITATNLCGELPLPDYGMCCLGSLVLPKFITGTKNTNWKKLEHSINNAVRFLDNVLDTNYFPIKQAEITTIEARRQGLGVMGLHDYLLAKEIRYGSERSYSEIDRLFKFIRDTAYTASIRLAEEKGTFPGYRRSEFCSSSFIKKLPSRIRLEIKKHGIRNCTLLSAQPTGTSSLIPEVSSGIEPIFALAYKRKDRVSDRYYIHPKLIECIKENKEKPEWLVDTADLKPEDHLEMQVTIQRFLDNACSKTINCPKGFTVSDLSGILLESIQDIKGCTIYVEGSRGEEVLNRMTYEEAKKHVLESTSALSEKDVGCSSGKCDI